MSYSRRNFIKAGAALGIVSLVSSSVLAAENSKFSKLAGDAADQSGLLSLSKSSFENRLGATFKIAGRSLSKGLRLLKVEDLPIVFQDPKEFNQKKAGECFRLVFYGYSNASLDQRTYTFVDSELGTFDLFIVPNRSEGTLHYYEAIINRSC